MPDRTADRGSAVMLGAVAIAAVLIALPHGLTYSQQEVLVFLTINVLVVASYRLLTLTGEWSLAHVVLMGVGGYASALYSKNIGLPVPLAILLGAATSGVVAFLLSFPLFRMKGFYFLIGSFAAGEVIRLVWKRFSDPFGGATGIKRIPPVPGLDLGVVRFDFFDPVAFYYLSLVVVLVSLFVLWRLERSRIGLTFHAIHWQDRLAESVGINTFRYRMLAFVVASFFAGVGGALSAHYLSTVNPSQFEVTHMVYVLIWTIVGGTARIYGPILGVVALTLLDEIVLRAIGIDQVRPLLYGVILIATVLFLPRGLESLVIGAGERISRLRPQTIAPAADAPAMSAVETRRPP